MSDLAQPKILAAGPLFALMKPDGALVPDWLYAGSTLPALETSRAIARRHAADRKAIAIPVKLIFDAEAGARIAQALSVWRDAAGVAEAKLRASGRWRSTGNARDGEYRHWTRDDGVVCTMAFEDGGIHFWRGQAGFPARAPIGWAQLGSPQAARLVARFARHGKGKS